MSVHALQLISQLDAELGIEKFRAELESTQVLVSLQLLGTLDGLCQPMHHCQHRRC